ncbi:glutamine amidotransferase (plasmid) [Pseudomonas nitroreducens]|uniref:glutamine amidotransferase n=1 Tax=Pseudomonas TaxID=286 RepID=UPI0003780F77|nr:glutamine amidotransferase [Pseudomonas nitroreducens]
MQIHSILLLQVGTPPAEIRDVHGDLCDWFSRLLAVPLDEMMVVRVFEGDPLPPPDPDRIAIITGSWAMVTERLPWSELTAQWIRDALALEMPLFGVCYGHQLMAHALGGRVDYHPDGRELGCKRVLLLSDASDDPLLESCPQSFFAQLTHEQSVLEAPPGATVLARTEHDGHQIIRYGRNAISAQFHPEFTPEILSACIRRRAPLLRSEGYDPQQMIDAIVPAPEAAELLRRFVATHREQQVLS